MKTTEQELNRIQTNFFDFSLNNTNNLLPYLIVFGLPVILYLQTISFGFTYFDDDQIILNNIEFLSDLANASEAFHTNAFISTPSRFYRPLQTLSYMVDIQISGGNNAWMYHLTNVLLLGLIASILFLVLKHFKFPVKLALMSTLVLCSHPLFVSSVAWLPARGDLLLLLFSLLSFLFFIKHLEKKNLIYLLLHWVTFTIACFCKETATFLPFLFIIYYFSFSFQNHFERRYLINIGLYAISGLFWFWMRSNTIGLFSDIVSLKEDVGLIALLSNLQTIPEALALFFVPANIGPIPSYSLVKTLIGSGILVVIAVLFVTNKERSKKEKLFGLVWFLLLLLPTMLFKHEHIDYLNHRFFLPLIGVLVFLLFTLPKKWYAEGDIKWTWIIVVLILFQSYLTVNKTRFYSDRMTFCNYAIAQNPKSALAYNNLGAAYHNKGLFDIAFNQYSKSIELKPDYAQAYFNRGNILFGKKSYDKALTDFTKSIEFNATDAGTYNNRGATYLRLGLIDKACSDFNKAGELGSKSAKTNSIKYCK